VSGTFAAEELKNSVTVGFLYSASDNTVQPRRRITSIPRLFIGHSDFIARGTKYLYADGLSPIGTVLANLNVAINAGYNAGAAFKLNVAKSPVQFNAKAQKTIGS